ncbi:MAG: hypothetical protein GWN58_30840, partial [Anaerolineae bacterium]|nr:hypothetical protein [Anaerolineae bacterium]
PEGTRLSHLRLDAQGHVNLLAARRHDSDRIDYRILSFDGNEPAGEQLYQETLPQGQQLSPLGWLDSRRMIILRSRLTPQRDHQVSLLEVRPGSAPVREVASVEHAFPSTAMLDPAHGRVYLTIADGAVHHGLLIRLADGSASRFTGTNLPGVTFADYRIVEDRGIVFVRQQTNNDIWLVQTDRQVEIR